MICFLFLFFVLSYSMKLPKLCINCKHFINNNNNHTKFGKCALLFKYENSYSLVNGDDDIEMNHYYCNTARNHENLCGKEGKLYERKVTKRVTNKNK